jgi:transposase
MPELPDPRSLSPEALELLRSLVVRAVIDLDLSQVDASTYYGVSPHTISEWVSRYREQGEDALAVQPQGCPEGAGRALSPEQEDEIRTLVVDCRVKNWRGGVRRQGLTVCQRLSPHAGASDCPIAPFPVPPHQNGS